MSLKERALKAYEEKLNLKKKEELQRTHEFVQKAKQKLSEKFDVDLDTVCVVEKSPTKVFFIVDDVILKAEEDSLMHDILFYLAYYDPNTETYNVSSNRSVENLEELGELLINLKK